MPLHPSLSSRLLLITLTSLLFTTPTTAQGTTIGIQNPSPFRLVESTQQPLVDLLSSKLEIVTLQDVLSAATLKTEPIELNSLTLSVTNGFRWSSSGGDGDGDDNDDDMSTDLWEPRGLALGEDRLEAEIWAKYDRGDDHDNDLDEVLAVAWADTASTPRSSNKGVRVSFVAPPTEDEAQVRGYIHVLLVEAVGNDDEEQQVSFRALRNVNAGGLVWHGNWLYVSDTADTAIRVFDLNNILKVDKGSGIGLVDGGGAYEAYGHLYVLPQARAYTFSPPEEDISFNCSYIALDRNTTSDGTVSLLAGERHATENVRLARWKIDLETSLPLITSESESNPPERIATAEWVYGILMYEAVGFASRGRNWFIASLNTDGGTSGELNVWRPKMPSGSLTVFPPHAGGVVYRKKGDQILVLDRKAGGTRGIWPFSALDLYHQWAAKAASDGIDIDPNDPDGTDYSPIKPPVSSESPTPSTPPASPASPTNSKPTSTGENSGGVSKGVIAGASVGGVFALLIIIAAIVFIWRKKRNQRLNRSDSPHGPAELGPNETWSTIATTTTATDVPSYRPELEAYRTESEAYRPELEAYRPELEAYRPELEGRQLRAELGGHEANMTSEEKNPRYQ